MASTNTNNMTMINNRVAGPYRSRLLRLPTWMADLAEIAPFEECYDDTRQGDWCSFCGHFLTFDYDHLQAWMEVMCTGTHGTAGSGAPDRVTSIPARVRLYETRLGNPNDRCFFQYISGSIFRDNLTMTLTDDRYTAFRMSVHTGISLACVRRGALPPFELEFYVVSILKLVMDYSSLLEDVAGMEWILAIDRSQRRQTVAERMEHDLRELNGDIAFPEL